MRRRGLGLAVVLAALVAGTPAARAQVPWDVYLDPESDAICDLVNAANLEVVVLTDTGELVVVTGDDYILPRTFVDEEGVFFFDGLPFGEVAFASDGDGFRTLWLLAPDGTVLELDEFTGEPIFTNLFPVDFVSVPCDACELWDDPADCVFDDDQDGIPDDEDFCPDTPPGEPVDADGCACFEVDSDGDGLDDCDDECPFDFGDDIFGCPCDEFDDDLDGVDNCDDACPDTPLNTFVTDDGCPCTAFDEDDDGINDCFDLCPNTGFGDEVDDDGCEIVVIVNPPPVFVACGNFSTLAMISTLCGLAGLGFVSRRRRSRMAGDPTA